MKILIACEYSGVVRRAFRDRGHDAWSCDILPSADDSLYHLQGDVLTVLNEGVHGIPEEWDMMIAHPPCTYLCNSGVRWMTEGEGTVFPGWIDSKLNTDRYYHMLKSRRFFMKLWNQPIPKIVIENPVPHKYAALPPYHQTIQPYQFGDDASKRTCLWLKGLPPIVPLPTDQWAPPRIVDGKKRWGNQTDSGQNKLGPSETRSLERAKTYEGIARAFAEQWG